MKLIEKQVYTFPNYGIPHENNLNLLGMILSSRRISHSIPVNMDIDPIAFASKIGNNDKDFMANIHDLWATTDALSIRHDLVQAKIMILNRGYKIMFFCYQR